VTTRDLLARCAFPASGTPVDLAVSGGADSTAMALLAHEAGLVATIHHVDHHLRATSGEDADAVARLAKALGFECVVHDVAVEPGGNLESRARAARRGVLPHGAMTAHTMDDLAETILINTMRGAGLDGLAPMMDDPTKPLVAVRRRELLEVVTSSAQPYCVDESNADTTLLRNKVRLEILPELSAAAGRDLVPVLARQARLIADELAWLDEVVSVDLSRGLDEVDCRELREWPVARQRRWLRAHLRSSDLGDGSHPPSADEVERALAVVRGEVVATELSGGRRLARSGQFLSLT
jgi:tRNA(Ile)-lysidine synthase